MNSNSGKTTAVAATLLVMSGCAADFQFSSNLDPAAIEDYFKAGTVTLYDGTVPEGDFEVVALVKGEACQAEARDLPVTLADARTQARRLAADKGATGLIIERCTLISEPDESCHSYSLCVGQAIRLSRVGH